MGLVWQHPAFDDLEFLPSVAVVGSMMSTSGGRVVANVTANVPGPTQGRSTLASILTIQLPPNALNNTILTCVGANVSSKSNSTVLLTGELLGILYII